MDATGYARLLGLHGDLRVDFVESAALAGNPLGDPATRPLAVYLPPGFDPQGSRRYPVVYVLPGYTGDVSSQLGARPWEPGVVQIADRAVASGAMPAAIVVIVDGNTRLGGSQYVDSRHNGAFATYVVRDVVAHVDATYPTVASEGGRAIVGKSSGGFGALFLAMTHPGTFAAFASHSGDAYFRYALVPGFVDAQRTLERHDRDPAAFVRAFEAKPKRSGTDLATILILGQAAAYSPRAAEAFAFDLPFDARTGEIRDDVFARWEAYDPVVLAPQRYDALARLRLRYVDCGRRDEYALDLGNRIFVERVRAMGLDVRHEEFDDGHRGVGYRFAISLPALVAVLESHA